MSDTKWTRSAWTGKLREWGPEKNKRQERRTSEKEGVPDVANQGVEEGQKQVYSEEIIYEGTSETKFNVGWGR